MLMKNDIYSKDFSKECYEYMDSLFKDKLDVNGNYIISPQEREQRTDLTKKLVCTIDPATARDLDDSLSIEKLSD